MEWEEDMKGKKYKEERRKENGGRLKRGRKDYLYRWPVGINKPYDHNVVRRIWNRVIVSFLLN